MTTRVHQVPAVDEPETAPIVYVVQHDGTKNFQAATQFGSVVPILNKGVYPDDWEKRVPIVRGIVRQKLSGFDEKKDYLLLVGDPILISLCIGTLMFLGVSRIRCLKWDREAQTYYEVVVEF